MDASEGHVKGSCLVALSEAERQRALERFYQLRPVLEEGVSLQRLAHDQHQFRSLSGLELQGVIEHQWAQLGLDMTLYEHADAAVVNAIARVTGGNFRLVQRLFAQIGRIVAINNLPTVTTEVVTLARERLVDAPV